MTLKETHKHKLYVPISMSCCCRIDRGLAGTLLDLFIMGPPTIPGRPMAGCPWGPKGLALGLDIPQSPGPAMGERCGIPMPLPMPPEGTHRR